MRIMVVVVKLGARRCGSVVLEIETEGQHLMRLQLKLRVNLRGAVGHVVNQRRTNWASQGESHEANCALRKGVALI